MPTIKGSPSVAVELIANRIYLIRGLKVMLDSDLAELYQVPTKVLNQAVKRNQERFPDDFMLRLTSEEAQRLNWSQSVTSSRKHRGISYLPLAFSEHGVAMLSSVLSSPRAVQMNILIIRAFIRIRELLATSKELAARVEKLEASHQDHASIISILATEIDTLKQLPGAEAPFDWLHCQSR